MIYTACKCYNKLVYFKSLCALITVFWEDAAMIYAPSKCYNKLVYVLSYCAILSKRHYLARLHAD